LCEIDGIEAIVNNKSSKKGLTKKEGKEKWKPFRNTLDKKGRKKFDEMWNIPRFYVSACSNSFQLVGLHPMIMSILFHHYKELPSCRSLFSFSPHSKR
jgi:hypothetical protein